MFKSGFEVDMTGLTPLSPSAEEEEVDCPNAFAVMPILEKTNARRRFVRTNIDFTVLCLWKCIIPFLFKNVKIKPNKGTVIEVRSE